VALFSARPQGKTKMQLFKHAKASKMLWMLQSKSI